MIGRRPRWAMTPYMCRSWSWRRRRRRRTCAGRRPFAGRERG